MIVALPSPRFRSVVSAEAENTPHSAEQESTLAHDARREGYQ
jgi:hypothetical protein